MLEVIIVAVVTIIALMAHWYLYRWVKFKMDEGAVLACFQPSDPQALPVTELELVVLAEQSGLSLKKVRAVCEKSAKLELVSGELVSGRVSLSAI